MATIKAPYRLQVYMDDQLRDIVHELAHLHRKSMTEYVTDLLILEASKYKELQIKLEERAQALTP